MDELNVFFLRARVIHNKSLIEFELFILFLRKIIFLESIFYKFFRLLCLLYHSSEFSHLFCDVLDRRI